MTLDAPLDSQAVRPWWSQLEPLWVPALALLIIIPGYAWGAAIIRLFGRGGQTETVEWATYMSVLVALPIAVTFVVYLLPLASKGRVAPLVKGLLIVLLAAVSAVYAVGHLRPVAAAAAMAVLTVLFLTGRSLSLTDGAARDEKIARLAAMVFIGTCAWMSAGSLESWSDATTWFLANPIRLAILLVSFGLSVIALRSDAIGVAAKVPKARSERIVVIAGMIVLVAFSFRTNPVVELYHWEAYVGPMQELRQGGWLLWDNPAQYGILSILLPTLFPGNGWQSFYLFQGICNAIVALLMFRALRGVRPSIVRDIVAVALTTTTLFFRPRSAGLLLAGQMTPSGGPVRFIWSFVMLAFVFGYYRRSRAMAESDARGDLRFALWGNAIWLGSLLWSVEAAIYCSAIWFPAYLIHVLRRGASDRRAGMPAGAITLRALSLVVLPFAALASLVVAISAFYRVALGHFPDWMGYVEYALLYGGGFRALPIDPAGSVWYLLIVFLAISTAAVIYLSRAPLHPRLMVLFGAWGGVWAISSYFVSRSHPANLLSIAPFLVVAMAISLMVLDLERWEPWHDVIRIAMVPIFAVPIALTIGHPEFVAQITTPQLAYGSFTDQIPLMEPSLNQLLLQAGVKPTDPVVRIGDGRLMLPAWRPSAPGQPRVVSPYSWLPKQYEIIGTLPASRRQKYIDRIADHLRLSGWLIHSKSGGIADYAQQLADISATHAETRRYENKDWIVSWYQLKK